MTNFSAMDGIDIDLSIVHPSRRLVSQELRNFIDLLVDAFPKGGKPLSKRDARRS